MTGITELVLASHNAGKVAEMEALLAPLAIRVLGMQALGLPAPEETGLSFIENAILKARAASQATGLPALADDSGLMVAALAGAPGIYSARYAGPEASDSDNIDCLLARLQGVPLEQRQAAFVCALALVTHASDPLPWIGTGQWQGHILGQRQGQQGFGYDPVFFDPRQGLAAAEMPPAQKAKLGHRGQAMRLLLAHLAQVNGQSEPTAASN